MPRCNPCNSHGPDTNFSLAEIHMYEYLDRFEVMAIKLWSNIFIFYLCIISMRISNVSGKDSNSLWLSSLPEIWNRPVVWNRAFSPVKKMEYKKNWEIFVESWNWFSFLMCRPTDKDTDLEFLPQHILLRHIFIVQVPVLSSYICRLNNFYDTFWTMIKEH